MLTSPPLTVSMMHGVDQQDLIAGAGAAPCRPLNRWKDDGKVE
ncbi:MAG: hypothetical protein SH859_15080 [Hyphomicrobium aestuarii]|nr:hypothetical protein [Hyphomicrobium aestuarii]